MQPRDESLNATIVMNQQGLDNVLFLEVITSLLSFRPNIELVKTHVTSSPAIMRSILVLVCGFQTIVFGNALRYLHFLSYP